LPREQLGDRLNLIFTRSGESLARLNNVRPRNGWHRTISNGIPDSSACPSAAGVAGEGTEPQYPHQRESFARERAS